MICDIDGIFDDVPHRQKDRLKMNVLAKIVETPGISRKDVTQELGARPSSVSLAVQELIDDQIVAESSSGEPAQRGRPEVALTALPDHWIAGCIFMESREFRAVLTDLSARIYPLYNIDSRARSMGDEFQLPFMTEALLDSAPPNARLVGIGYSMPGFEHPVQHQWVSSTRRSATDMHALSAGVAERGVSINWIRSLDARLQGVLRKNPEYRIGKTALFHWGYGIGVSLSIDGNLLNSSFTKFGEIGHTIVHPRGGSLCRCGARGCLETEAALWSIIPSLKERFDAVPENERAFGPFLNDHFLDELPEIENAITYINLALVNLSKLFSPDRILLYGPFTDHDLVYQRIQTTFRDNQPREEFSDIVLERVQHDPLDEVVGATNRLFVEALRNDLQAVN